MTNGTGVVRMKYAHVCKKVTEDLGIFATLHSVLDGFYVPADGTGRFPPGYSLASSFIAYGGAPGPRHLIVSFTDNHLNVLHSTPGTLEFSAKAPGYPATAHQAIELLDFEIPGPGMYYFDCIVSGVHAGRLPLMMMGNDRTMPAEAARLGRVSSADIRLDWGHLLTSIEEHADGTKTLHNVHEIYPVLTSPNEPFAMGDSKLLLQLSAPAPFAGDHHIGVKVVDADGQRVADIASNVRLYEVFPGRVGSWAVFDLSPVGFPKVGDYTFEISADGKPAGLVEIVAVQAKLVPE